MSSFAPPMLTRRSIARAALEVMDRDGYAAFTVPRLSTHLGVRTASLYHHFRDRADILAEVARMIVLETEVPDHDPGRPWTEYYVQYSVNFRRTLLRHRQSAPVLLQFLPRDVLLTRYEAVANQLAHHPEVPPSKHVLFMEGLEKLTLGSALVEAAAPMGTRSNPFPSASEEEHPALMAAARSNELEPEQLFIEVVRTFLEGIAGTNRPQTRSR